jgi:site-specific DNA-methyltransferase (adenine-specific)
LPKRASSPRFPLLVHGDCLIEIPKLAPVIDAAFDLVYVDPPFNAGGTRKARHEKGERISGQAAYIDSWGGIDAFLSMLKPRLIAVREIMSDRGSLWVHLDQRTVHDTKVLLDGVFGRNCFQGEVIWVPGNGSKRKTGPGMTHQTILVYSRAKQMIWNDGDAMLREPFADTSLRMHFNQIDGEGRRYRERKIAGKSYHYYADVGRKIGSVWSDCPAMSANTPLTDETTGYPTQKPEKLLERIIRASSLPESHVLDPMCGSGTTIAVATRLGRKAVGIDMSPIASEIARKRLERAASIENTG